MSDKNSDAVEAVRREVNKAVETSAIITEGIPLLNIIASVVLDGEEVDYCGCVAASDLTDLDPEEHIVQLSTTVIKSVIVFMVDTAGKEKAREIFADALLEALVQSGLEDAKELLNMKNRTKKYKEKPNWKNSPWFKYGKDDDKYDFKEI